MGKPALQIVLDAIKEKRIALVKGGESPESLEMGFLLQMPKALIDRAIKESEVTAKHPKTGKLITVGSLDGRKFFGLRVVIGEEIDIIKMEDYQNGSMGKRGEGKARE